MDYQEKQEYEDALGGFVGSYRWHYWITLTFKDLVGFEAAHCGVQELLEPLGPDSYAYLAPERGYAGGHINYHLLLGWRTGKITQTNTMAMNKILERARLSQLASTVPWRPACPRGGPRSACTC